MIPFLMDLLWSETSFVQFARAAFLIGGSMVMTGDLPSWVPTWVGVLLMGIGGYIKVGDKNKE